MTVMITCTVITTAVFLNSGIKNFFKYELFSKKILFLNLFILQISTFVLHNMLGIYRNLYNWIKTC